MGHLVGIWCDIIWIDLVTTCRPDVTGVIVNVGGNDVSQNSLTLQTILSMHMATHVDVNCKQKIGVATGVMWVCLHCYAYAVQVLGINRYVVNANCFFHAYVDVEELWKPMVPLGKSMNIIYKIVDCSTRVNVDPKKGLQPRLRRSQEIESSLTTRSTRLISPAKRLGFLEVSFRA